MTRLHSHLLAGRTAAQVGESVEASDWRVARRPDVQLRSIYEEPAHVGIRVLVDRRRPRGMSKSRALWMSGVERSRPRMSCEGGTATRPTKFHQFRSRYHRELRRWNELRPCGTFVPSHCTLDSRCSLTRRMSRSARPPYWSRCARLTGKACSPSGIERRRDP